MHWVDYSHVDTTMARVDPTLRTLTFEPLSARMVRICAVTIRLDLPYQLHELT
jgi:hypothetical protein